jgi:GNAT superfamily N-acetyltransferase
VIDHGAYLVVRTRDNPSYHLGNCLVLDLPPRIGEVGAWKQVFDDEFRDLPAVRHVALRWQGDPAPLVELVVAGFKIEITGVWTAAAIAPAQTALEVRALRADEMPAVSALTFSIADDHSEAYRQFLNRRTAWTARMIERGAATWYGAFDGSALVGSLGLVTFDRIARFQDVQTEATHRRRGVASSLLAAAARTNIDRYVILAEPNSDAARVYKRAGFVETEERLVSARSSR